MFLTSGLTLLAMAVFMINICKYNGCGITFPRLNDLIEHIEDVHIDLDPAVVEQKEASQPACIPLSYVLKFITEASRRENQSTAPAAPDVRRRLLSVPKTPSVRSSTPTGSEMDEDEMMSPSEDSNDSWTMAEEYSSEFILRYGIKLNANAASGNLGAAAQEKPFACPVPGCKKRYKNVNGIKYHSKNGHKKDGKKYPVPLTPDQYSKRFIAGPKKHITAQEYFWKKWGKKAYKCQCGKSYKTAQGLKSHSISQHIVSSSASSDHKLHVPKMPGLVVTSSPARTINLVDAIDGNKLVRIYDTIKAKDLQAFTIPKHSLTSVNIVSANQVHSALLTPSTTPGSSPVEKVKFDRSPKVTVQTTQMPHLTNIYRSESNN